MRSVIQFFIKSSLIFAIFGYCLQAQSAGKSGDEGEETPTETTHSATKRKKPPSDKPTAAASSTKKDEEPDTKAKKAKKPHHPKKPSSAAAGTEDAGSDSDKGEESEKAKAKKPHHPKKSSSKTATADASSDSEEEEDVKLTVPIIRQVGGWGCAEAAVQMVLNYLKIPYHALPNIAEIRDSGLDIMAIKEFMEHYDFNAGDIETLEHHKMTLHDLLGHYGPIVFIRKLSDGDLHALVMTGIVGDTVLYNDPAKPSEQSMKLADLKKEDPVLLYHSKVSKEADNDGSESPKHEAKSGGAGAKKKDKHHSTADTAAAGSKTKGHSPAGSDDDSDPTGDTGSPKHHTGGGGGATSSTTSSVHK